MKKFYTYVLVSLIIFASLSISPTMVRADDGVGPEILKIELDNERVTRGQKVSLKMFASDRDGMASMGLLEILTPGGDRKTIQLSLNDDYYIYTFNLSETWEYAEFGTYKIISTTLYDRYGNVSRINLEKDDLDFELYLDNEAPVVTEVNISRPSIYSVGYEELSFTVRVEDEGRPSNNATLYLKHIKSGQEKTISLLYYEDEKAYKGYEWYWYDATFGEWIINRIELSDVAGNQQISYGPYVGEQSFKLLNLTDDKENPQYISSSFEDGTQTYTVKAIDNSYVSEIKVTLRHRATGRETVLLPEDNQIFNHPYSSGMEMSVPLKFNLNDTFNVRSGFWDVIEIEIIDRNQNTTVITNIDDSIYLEPYIVDLGVHVIKNNETLFGQYFDRDVFVMPGTVLSTFSNVTMSKNLYVMGALRIYGGLSVSGTLYGNRMTLGHSSPIYNGDIQVSGSNYLWNTHITNLIRFTLPLNTGGALYKNEDNTFDVFGLTLPLANKISINGVETELDQAGRFKALNVPMNETATADVQVTAANGMIYSTNLKIYDKQKPIVTASKDSGIYLAGTSLNIVSTREGIVYYNFSPGAGPSDLFSKFPTDYILNNDVEIKYYSVDPIGNESEVSERKYRVFSVYSPKASDSFIQGSGSPGLKIQAEVDEKTYVTTINSEGYFLIEGLDLTKSKQVQIFATDEEYTSEAYTFDIIDDLPIVIEGAENQKVYNRDVTITYNKGDLYLNEMYYVSSGTTFTEDERVGCFRAINRENTIFPF